MDDKIKQLAIKAGAQYFQHADYWMTTDLNIHQFAELVAASEREACAKVCESLRPSKSEYDQRFYDGCTASSAAIRARSKND